jgi:methionyl-tRNA synthetase
MTPEKKKYYLTTPIYYVNARPHLGHTYTTVVADTIARFRRMRGDDVVLLTGTDEHGQKVERAAKAAGVTPQEYADRISMEYRALWKELGLGIDRFVRTTENRHERAVHRLLLQARDMGYIYKGSYEGDYCVHDEIYVDETLPGGLCPECKRPTERIREENYYFKLSAFQDRLLELYEQQPDFIQPETRRNEVMAFVKGGLRDLSVSRTSVKWGIDWPDDEKHVFYVWYDALTSYMTGVGYGDDELQWEKYWPADLHLIGKEILRFHAVYWPAFLMAAEEPLPKRIYAHGWWLFQEEKMSKSRGNMQYPQPIARTLGADALRYFLLREMVFGQDGSFSRDSLLTRYNSDLANGLGNLASRVLAMIGKYFAGEIPEASDKDSVDEALLAQREPAVRAFVDDFERFAFSRGLEAVWGLIAAVDKYLVETKPWTLGERPEMRARLGSILWSAAECLRVVTVLVAPVMPEAAQKIWRQLGLPGSPAGIGLPDEVLAQTRILQAGTQTGEAEAIFPRVDKKETSERIEAMEEEIRNKTTGAPAAPAGEPSGTGSPTGTAAAVTAGTPVAPLAAPVAAAAAPAVPARITIDDFSKVEMRVGVVKSAEKVQGAYKLLKVLVDIGTEVRQVVAGIAEAYKPEDLAGKKVVVVVNLAPRKLRGVESNGMILAASAAPDGRPILATFAEDVPAGTRLK